MSGSPSASPISSPRMQSTSEFVSGRGMSQPASEQSEQDSRIAALMAEIAALRSEHAVLKSESSQMKLVLKDVEKVNQELQEVKKESESVKQELVFAKDKNEELEKTLEATKTQLGDSEKKEKAVKEQNEKTRAQINELESKASKEFQAEQKARFRKICDELETYWDSVSKYYSRKANDHGIIADATFVALFLRPKPEDQYQSQKADKIRWKIVSAYRTFVESSKDATQEYTFKCVFKMALEQQFSSNPSLTDVLTTHQGTLDLNTLTYKKDRWQ